MMRMFLNAFRGASAPPRRERATPRPSASAVHAIPPTRVQPVEQGVTQLRGRLDTIGLMTVVRLLGQLRKTGQLRVSQDGWTGHVFFRHGQMVSVRFRDQEGVAAFGELMLEATGAEFVFDETDELGAVVFAPDRLEAPQTPPAQPVMTSDRLAQLRTQLRTRPDPAVLLRARLRRLVVLVTTGAVPAVALTVLILLTSRAAPRQTQNVPGVTDQAVATEVPSATSTPQAELTPVAIAEPPGGQRLGLLERAPGSPSPAWEIAADGLNGPPDFAPRRARTWTTSRAYELTASIPGQFVAMTAALSAPLTDVSVRASFQKIGGPSGGSYGIVIGDQDPAGRDGGNQGGRFYVVEASDRGEAGIWQRDGDKWVEIYPWTPTDAVHPGTATNQLRIDNIGDRLVLFVNGTEITEKDNLPLRTGSVGAFVGGDLNQAELDGLTIQAPI